MKPGGYVLGLWRSNFGIFGKVGPNFRRALIKLCGTMTTEDDNRPALLGPGRRTSRAELPDAFSSKILLWNGQAILCTLRERSNVGARLTVETQVHIPPVFTLEIAPGREQLPARLAWRKQGEIGVVFLEVV